jgi:hypothetical protein
VSWWPSALKGNLDVKKIRAAGFELYMIERPATSVDPEIYLMAIDWHKNRGFFYTKWTAASPYAAAVVVMGMGFSSALGP